MKPKIKALVVEDDLEIRAEIEDVLGLLGHEHDWAESQQEAHELIEQNHYHYVLADLEIPARPGRGFAKIEYGKKLIGQIQQIKGRGVIPVIVMTGYHKHGLNLALELLGNGVMDFISKPFGDGTEGKSLPQVIQAVLDKHRKAFPPGVLPGDPPEPSHVGHDSAEHHSGPHHQGPLSRVGGCGHRHSLDGRVRRCRHVHDRHPQWHAIAPPETRTRDRSREEAKP